METEKFNRPELESRFTDRFSQMDQEEIKKVIEETENALSADHTKDMDWDENIESQLKIKLEMAKEALAVDALTNPDALYR